MKKIFTLLSLALPLMSIAQTDIHLTFPPKVGGADLVVNTNVQDLNGVTMKINDFCYYISNVHIFHDGGQDLDLSDTVIIVRDDAFDINMGAYNVTTIESIDFGVGVPQAINHEDISQYETNDPLSWQSPSMHWGWTSGYKFLLVDGWGDGTGNGDPESVFQLHDLGDANYKYVSMPVVQTNFPNHIAVVINCNLDEWIWGAHPGTSGVNHGSTGINASTMSNVNNRTVFEQPANASIKEITQQGQILFNVIGNELGFTWKDVTGAASYRLVDAAGRLIEENEITSPEGKVSVSNLTSGTYLFYILNKNNQVINTIQALK